MIIGIDGNEANVEKKVGIGEYAFELLLEFGKLQRDDLKFRIYLKEPPKPDMPSPTPNFSYKIIGPKMLWTRFALPLNLFFGSKPDVFFTPTHYGPRFASVPTAISIMDLSFLHFPKSFKKNDLYQLKNWTKFSARKAAKIFTISEFSKNDIIKTYGKDPKDVVVTYPGIKKSENKIKELDMNDLKKKFGINASYILFVGTLQPRKNITKLIEAFSKINKNNIQLVIVGKKGWLYEDILEAPKKFGVEDKVRFLDFVENEDLFYLYKNALCFVLPSLYEGFGLPVLEAMKYGCPVLASNVSSLPEAGGDAAVYFNPMDVDDIKEKIDKVISDEKLREEMRKKGFKQVKKFSWEKTAKKTLAVLEELAKSS
jgi:glycosyltransferase involved in cell wall biosynthesis